MFIIILFGIKQIKKIMVEYILKYSATVMFPRTPCTNYKDFVMKNSNSNSYISAIWWPCPLIFQAINNTRSKSQGWK